MRIARLALTLLVLTIVLSVIPNAHRAYAAPPTSSFGVSVSPDYVQVSVRVNVLQNLTEMVSSFSMPSFNGTLAGNNSSDLASSLKAAIDEKTPQATISDLNLGLATTSVSSSKGLQWFNVSLEFRLFGIQSVQNGLNHINMSWKSFSIHQNVTIGGVEVNNIGNVYLQSPSSQIAQIERAASSPTSLVTYSNIVNYFRVTPANLVSATARVNLFNFTQLFPALDTWSVSYDASSNTENWSLNPVQLFGMIVTATSKEPQATPTTNVVIYTIHAEVSAPARSYVQGDSLVASFSDSSEIIMSGVIVSGLIILAGALLIERRISKKTFRRKPKR